MVAIAAALSEPIETRNTAAEIALLCLLATLWGASYAFIKLGVATIPPVTLIAARTVIAGLLLVVVMRVRGRSLPRDAATWRRFLFQALLNSVIPFTLIAWAEQTVDSGLATILNSTSPIFTFLLTWVAMRHQRVMGRKLAGVVAGLAGICLIVGVEALGGLGRELIAQLAIVAATVCYAGAAIFGRSFKGLDPIAPAAGSLLCGAAVLIPLSFVIDRPWTLAPSLSSVMALLALSVFSTAFALVIYFRLLRTLGSVGITAQAYLRVPVGVLIGVLFLGESLASTVWIGLACVVAGVAAMAIPGREKLRRVIGVPAQNGRLKMFLNPSHPLPRLACDRILDRSLRPGTVLMFMAVAARTLCVWRQCQRQRNALAKLDQHLLRDIGKSRAEADIEIAKPFWKA